MKKLGVLGGMGPAASAEFMVRLTKLTPATKDQEHIPTILWSDPRVPDRNLSIQRNNDFPLPWLISGIKGLQKAECDHIVIPCNTAHFWYGDLVRLGTPITHIVDSVEESLIEANAQNKVIGIMGTQATLNMGLYQNRLIAKGWKCITPDQNDIDYYIQPAINLIKGGHLDEAEALLLFAVRALIKKGAQIIVLGCTELPLALRCDTDMGVILINSIDSLAKSAIKLLTKK